MDGQSGSAACRIVIWNIQWKRVSSPSGRELRRRIDVEAPDVVCITEGHEDFLPSDGFTIAADADFGQSAISDKRKVILWSRNRWQDVDRQGCGKLPGGRFVRGRTETSIGELDILGVCIPWRSAQEKGGKAPWEQHRRFLEGLDRILAARPMLRTVIVGDFNQHLPRRTAPPSISHLLETVLNDRLDVATRGIVSSVNLPSIDHLAHSRDLSARGSTGLSNMSENGRRLSDHFGIALELAR